ncbi:hypothetical protein KC347_g124 [Hortaea werneckii]|nr:hypothetical protein KC347_g124 [Hortaea werneckii]
MCFSCTPFDASILFPSSSRETAAQYLSIESTSSQESHHEPALPERVDINFGISTGLLLCSKFFRTISDQSFRGGAHSVEPGEGWSQAALKITKTFSTSLSAPLNPRTVPVRQSRKGHSP